MYALVQACFSKYDQKFKNSSNKVKQTKFGKSSADSWEGQTEKFHSQQGWFENVADDFRG
jgi:hypothetical protein